MGTSVRITVGWIMGVAGLLVFFGFMLQDPLVKSAAEAGQMPWGLLGRYVAAMFFGGAVAGALLSALFGRNGFAGWCLALLAAFLCALISGVFGSAIGLAPDVLADGWQSKDLVPILAGLLVFPLAVIDYVWLLPLWLIIAAFAHMRAKTLRA